MSTRRRNPDERNTKAELTFSLAPPATSMAYLNTCTRRVVVRRAIGKSARRVRYGPWLALNGNLRGEKKDGPATASPSYDEAQMEKTDRSLSLC